LSLHESEADRKFALLCGLATAGGGAVISGKIRDEYNCDLDAQTHGLKDRGKAVSSISSALQPAASGGSLMITTEAMVAELMP
jgi:hypothetical protein